ncbi:MAG: potassium/proton antiporter [Fimbriimonadaceae bacterium]
MKAEYILVAGALFLLISILASKLSAKLGVPALIVFIGLGMLAGSEGPGGIAFADYKLANTLGMILLGFILFASGMDTSWEMVRPVAWRALSLATIGVAMTAGLVGLFAHYVLGFSIIEGLLLGAIVAPTDAAAVFSVLRTRGLTLKHRVTPLLEFESGANDPVAVILTVGLVDLIANPERSVWPLVPSFLQQMPIGIAVGIAISMATVWLINHLRLEYDGLYPVLTLASAGGAYGAAYLLGGNGFIAVYVAGIVLGSKVFLHKIALTHFHDGLAWLFQIIVFTALGLLVFPSQLVPIIGSGILLALFMTFIARPAAVFISLAFARMGRRTRFFVAWAGLRGAFPIILGTFPLLAGLERGYQIFNLVFFVVVASVLMQGTTLRLVARKLGMLSGSGSEDDLTPASQSDLLEITLADESPAVGKQVVELGLPSTALIVLLKREEGNYIPRGSTILMSGDELLVATRREDRDELAMRLRGSEGL